MPASKKIGKKNIKIKVVMDTVKKVEQIKNDKPVIKELKKSATSQTKTSTMPVKPESSKKDKQDINNQITKAEDIAVILMDQVNQVSEDTDLKIKPAKIDAKPKKKGIRFNEIKPETSVQTLKVEDVPLEKPIAHELHIDEKKIDDVHELKNQVEALLFACGKYMDEGSIAELCNIDKRKIRKILDELKNDYDSKDTALTLFQEDKSWKINVREKYVSLVRKIVSDTELPRSTMETLAVIAWKTPLYQSEVVRIRGNKCYDHIEELENQGFITKEKKGRSYVLKTTDKFYNYFDIDRKNMSSIMDSVKLPELKPEQTTLEIKDVIPADEQNKVEAIELRKMVETEEDKLRHHTFLNEMEQKILEVAKKNVELDAEIPTRMTKLPGFDDNGEAEKGAAESGNETPEIADNTQSENIVMDAPVESSDENLVIDTTQKPKKLTKKQLEKKFKDDLVRVREKMEKK